MTCVKSCLLLIGMAFALSSCNVVAPEPDPTKEQLFGVFDYGDFHLMVTVDVDAFETTIFRVFDQDMIPIEGASFVLRESLGGGGENPEFAPGAPLFIGDTVSLFGIGESIVVFHEPERQFDVIPYEPAKPLIYADENYVHVDVALGYGNKLDIETGEIVEEYTFPAYRVPEIVLEVDPRMDNIMMWAYPHPRSAHQFSPELNEAYLERYGLTTYWKPQ